MRPVVIKVIASLLVVSLAVCCLNVVEAEVQVTKGSVAACTNCSLRDWLINVQEEVADLKCVERKLEKAIKAIQDSGVVDVASDRIEQLAKVKISLDKMTKEISIIEKKCSQGYSPDCDEEKPTFIAIDNIFTYGGDALTSCAQYKTLVGDAATSGLYWIKPNPSKAKFVVYCEQSFNGGGWSLISSRSLSTLPKYADIVKPENDGSSMQDEKWATLRSASSEIMWKDAIGTEYAVSLISTWKTGICKPLTTNLTDQILAHKENSGCDGSGSDYCYLGFSGRNSVIYGACTSGTYKEWKYNNGDYSALSKANVYVR